MNLTLTLALGLFILAPGLAVFAGIFAAKAGPLQAPPPPPGSLIAITIVVFGALVSHAVAALLFSLNDIIVAYDIVRIGVPGWRNVYVLLLTPPSQEGAPIWTGTAATTLMSVLLSLSILAFFAVERITEFLARKDRVGFWFYGWTQPLLKQLSVEDGKIKIFTAFIVTDLEAEGFFVGYEGIVDDLSVDHAKAIERVVLIDCTAFHLHLTKNGIEHSTVSLREPIPRLYIDKSQIKNIAFNVLTVDAQSLSLDLARKNA